MNIRPAERITKDEISKICYVSRDPQSYGIMLDSSRRNDKGTFFQWEGPYVDDYTTRGEGSLVDSFSYQADQGHYRIADEHGTEYSIEDFLKKIKHSGTQRADMLTDTTPPVWYSDNQSVRESGFGTHFRISNKANGGRKPCLV